MDKPIFGIDRLAFPADGDRSDGEMETMRKLRRLFGCRVVGFYLAPAPNHSDTSWMGRRAKLAEEGWGFIPTYLGEQGYSSNDKYETDPNPNVNAANGKRDGTAAAKLARRCDSVGDEDADRGFALGSIIYLDWEAYRPLDGLAARPEAKRFQEYILAWRDAVKAAGFFPGFYSYAHTTEWARQYGFVTWTVAIKKGGFDPPAQPLDPKSLPTVDLSLRDVAQQYVQQCKFQGVTRPAEVDAKGGPNWPQFDLNLCAVADPSDLACVDERLNNLESPAPADISVAPTIGDRIAEGLSAIVKEVTAAHESETASARSEADAPMAPYKVSLTVTERDAPWVQGLGLDLEPAAEEFSATLESAQTAAGTTFPLVKWPSKDIDAPDYAHLSLSQVAPLAADGSAAAEEFEITITDIETIIAANRFQPIAFDDVIAIGIRGARLGGLLDRAPTFQVENVTTVQAVDIRPTHCDFRCLIGYYFRDENIAGRSLSLYSASTVPNPLYVTAYYNHAHDLPPPPGAKSPFSNLLPTGCYNFFVGRHRSISHALLLADWRHPGQEGCPTVLRAKSASYTCDEFWDQTTQAPGDHVHCSYARASVPAWGAPFSSAGCLTVRGVDANGPTDQWRNFKDVLVNRVGFGNRCDMVMVSGRDIAIASKLRIAAAGAPIDPSALRRELVRLRPGSVGGEVNRLRTNLNLDARIAYFDPGTKAALVAKQREKGVQADGVYSPALDQQWNWKVFDPVVG